MKNNKLLKWIAIVISVIFFASLCIAVNVINTIFSPFEDFVRRGPDFYDTDNIGSYGIDPQNIFVSLDNNETKVFAPLTAMSDALLEQDPILWRQYDYLRIANAAFETQWPKQNSDWHLSRIFFGTACQDFSKGFDYAIFTYYREVWSSMELRYLGRRIEIYPQYREVDWSGDAYYYPPLFYLEKAIDPKNLKFGADTAVDMGESNGGNTARLKVNNKCSIQAILDGNEKRGWEVVYEGDESMLRIFEVYIDPYTGEISQK